FMDPLADKLLVTGAFLVLIQFGRIEAWMVFVILAREFAVSGLRTLAAAQNVIIAASSYGKIKTVAQIIAIVVLLLDNYPFSIINLPMDFIMTYASLIITVISGIDYFIKNMHILKKYKQ
ncbi:MAG: CDP-diacylglycerol--glycerol-3-phosphate 3-phosphatidyltransferase, partial [Gracilibacteraceae bacterium]|nr:CDP-diacylglycerol--glycerol-3-phosphate 3-phosphatidyltransferase [Gracilibacteraceae bacterium]